MTGPQRSVWLLAVAAVCAVLLSLSLLSDRSTGRQEGPREALRIGVTSTDPSAILFYIARDRGFFTARGLDVSLTGYPTGLLALEDMAKNRLDTVSASEFVTATQFFGRRDLRILASLARLDTHRVVARKDRVSAPDDLQGKRIGVTRNTSGDFFLETFLTQHGIPLRKVKVVDLPTPRMEAAIAAGSVDALLTWGLQAERIRLRLGSNGIQWPGQGGRGFYMCLVSQNHILRRSPVAAERLLTSLIAAEEFIANHPAEVKRFMIERLGYGADFLETLWPHSDFRIRLDQDLLILMEDEARWAIRHRRQKGPLPNYLEAIHWESLEKVRPEAATIIH